MEPFEGRLDGKGTATNQIRITLDADAGDVIVGGNLRGGDIKLRDADSVTKIRFDAGGAETPVLEPTATENILLSGDTGTVSLIRKGPAGTRVAGVSLNAAGDMSVGRKDDHDFILLKNKDGKRRIHLDAKAGNIWLGGNDAKGDLVLFPSVATDNNDTSQATIWLNGDSGNLQLRHVTDGKYKDPIHMEPANAKILLGGNDADGDVLLFNKDGDNQTTEQATIWIQGKTGDILLRHKTDGKYKDRIRLEPDNAKILLGGNNANGDLLLFDENGDNQTIDQATIWIQGKTGDIILRNADCAEDFDVSDSEKIEPGTVMVLDREGKLEQSAEAYDKKVAGVISGAGGYQPGIVLDKKKSENQRLPVALIGKVYCKVDAEYSSIEVGDLLTTSPTRGHAMKASDPLKAFGAVIGKALHPLAAGQGLIPMLIALQ